MKLNSDEREFIRAATKMLGSVITASVTATILIALSLAVEGQVIKTSTVAAETTNIINMSIPQTFILEDSIPIIESDDEPTVKDTYYELPDIDSSFKCYMDYRTITSRSSVQYKLQQNAVTDDKGFRKYDEMYMVAVGTYFADECGKILEIELDSGVVFKAIVSDIKNDLHTDSTQRYVPINGNMVEFIVDVDKISNKSRRAGDMSHSGLQGNIVSIKEVRQWEIPKN